MSKRLTAASMAALRPQATAYYVSDLQQVGLRVRIAPSGAMSWNMAYRIKGKATKSVSLGSCDPTGRSGLSIAEARERAASIVKAARLGRDLLSEEADERVAQDSSMSVQQLIEGYAKSIASPNRKGGALRTAADIERRLIRALSPKLGMVADQLSRGEISRLLDPLAEQHSREAEKRRQVIGAMYRWGIAKGFVAVDPTAGSEGYGRGEPRDRVLAANEIKAFWDWLADGAANMPPDCIAALRLQLCTGARIGEIAGMDVAELQFEENKLIWVLPKSRSKNKQERVTPLVGMGRDIVEQAFQTRKSGPLFRTAISDRVLSSTDVGQALKKRKLPCAHFSTHDLRRTVVSAMDELGIPLDTIAAVVGHQRGSRDTRTLVRHYSRPQLNDRIENALSSWDKHLRKVIASRDAGEQENIFQLRAS
jgi:integrase